MKLGLLAVPLAFLLAISVGCSDSSDTLTLDEYFAEFEAIDADVDAEFEAAFAVFPEDEDFEAFLEDDGNVPAVKEFTAALPVIIGDAIDRVEALDPPSEVETEHDNLIDAGDDLVVAFEEGNELIQDAETMAEFDFQNSEVEATVDAAQAAFDEACLDLVAVGEANGVTVNVTCEDDV